MSFLKRLFHVHNWKEVKAAVIYKNGLALESCRRDYGDDKVVFDRICRTCERVEFEATKALNLYKNVTKAKLVKEKEERENIELALQHKFIRLKNMRNKAIL